MARIRTIKPEFWTDDLVGSLTREQRLLFIACWNLADDEGLLRWSAPFLKGAVFPFDDDISVKSVDTMMAALVSAGIVFSYVGGRSQQPLGCIVNFHRHQKINRPSPSKLPPPPVADPRIRKMYAARDGHVCHLCDGKTDEVFDFTTQGDFEPSPDHIVPKSKGGTDYPSNIRNAHITCNKGRGNQSVDEYRNLVMSGNTVAQKRHPERFTHIISERLSEHLSDGSPPEGEGEHGYGNKDLGPNKDIVGADAPGVSQGFEDFWVQFPKTPNMSKAEARKAWERLQREGALPEAAVLIEAVRGYALFLAQQSKGRKEPYPPTHAAKWLNEKRFEGFIEEAKARALAHEMATKHTPDWADLDPVWAKIKERLSPREWSLYFKEAHPNGSPTVLVCHSRYARDKIAEAYGEMIAEAFGTEVHFKFEAQKPKENRQ